MSSAWGGETAYGAGRAVEAAGDVDGDQAAGSAQGFGRDTIDVPGQAGAVDGVDDQVGAGGGAGAETMFGAVPAGGGDGRVGAAAWGGGGGDGDRPAGLLEQAGDDIAVAAVVAWAAEDEGAARADAGAYGARRGAAGVFHQLEGGDGVGGQAVGGGHFVGG